jgi:hypothetical protein
MALSSLQMYNTTTRNVKTCLSLRDNNRLASDGKAGQALNTERNSQAMSCLATLAKYTCICGIEEKHHESS